MSEREGERAPDGGRHCADVQSVLFDYQARELGEARAVFVREHLRRCPNCQAEAAQIRNTLDLLRAARPPDAIPPRLSEAHRRRLRRAVLHPVLDWMDRRHTAIALALAAILLAAAVLGLIRWMDWQPEPLEPGPDFILIPSAPAAPNATGGDASQLP